MPWMLRILSAASGLALSFSLLPAASPPLRFLVVCSPGSPGTTLQAQATMDSLARAAESGAGWPEGSLGAAYFETAEAGVARLSGPDAVLALVPPAFLSRYGGELTLKPRMEAILQSGRRESWSLVAKKGRVTSPDSLKGWELTGAPGFAPDFVRGVLLKDWGALPPDARITFTSRVLTALRRAAAGEDVAVILDAAGVEALPSLPFGAEMVTVTRSRPLPGAYLCTVGDRLPPKDAEALYRGLARLPESESGSELLNSLRLSRFEPVGKTSREGHSQPDASRPGSKP